MRTTTILLFLMLASLALAPPAGAQGEAAGSEMCANCHQAVGNQFKQNLHARIGEFEARGAHRGCEACHGASRQHAESGNPELIFSFKKAEGREINRACQTCHAENVGHEWASSDHALTGLDCADCHRIHQSRKTFPTTEKAYATLTARYANAPPPRGSLTKPEPTLCLDCHKERRAQMMFTSHHPVREGKMKCSSCHQVHGSPLRQLKTEERVNELCLKCHTAKQGPFVFEHAPVAENCLTCHEPHGTVANNLLRQNEPFLCLQCHEAHFHIGRSGISTPLSLPSGSASNRWGERGWRVAFGTKCTQCHSQIHGTDLPSQSVAGRGKALTR